MRQKTWWEENEPFGFLSYIYRVVVCAIAEQFGTVTIRYSRHITPFVDHHWYVGGVEVHRGVVHWNSVLWQDTTWSIFGHVVGSIEQRVEDGCISTTWVEQDDVSKTEYLESVTKFLKEKANPEEYEISGAIAKHGIPAMAEKSAAWLSRTSNHFCW